PPRPGKLAGAVANVRARIAAAAGRAGRDPASVTLVAAAKTVSAPRVAEVLALGVLDVGENRAQELLAKAPALAAEPSPPRWHFVGRLQRNKVSSVAPWVTLWQSVDREPLGVAIARRAPGARVLVEVNLGAEAQKGGCEPSATPVLVDALRDLGLDVGGLMTVHPQDGDARRWFVALRELGDRLGLRELSMGMTDDFDVAVEEGATIVRVGRALFGAR
ncbi:MAG: YggS family pyridoxal phosphate-dependent enzyme, partial [Acidimicrobiia bacterium]